MLCFCFLDNIQQYVPVSDATMGFCHPLMSAMKAVIACLFSGLNCYRRQIESSQVDLLGLSDKTGSPACMHATGLQKLLTVNSLGEQRRLKDLAPHS